MVSLREVNKQLKSTGYYYRFWMRKEVRELSKVLDEDENIKQCVNGYYDGGLALLAATDRRLLLIDCKPMYLTLEVIWYDKIGQIDYNHRMLNASICISTPNKELNFTSYNTQHLRKTLLYTQEKIAEPNKSETAEESATPSNMSYHGQSAASPAETVPAVPSPVLNAPSQNFWTPRRQRFNQPQPNGNGTVPSFESSSNRLPFSRRRYFVAAARGESEPLA